MQIVSTGTMNMAAQSTMEQVWQLDGRVGCFRALLRLTPSHAFDCLFYSMRNFNRAARIESPTLSEKTNCLYGT